MSSLFFGVRRATRFVFQSRDVRAAFKHTRQPVKVLLVGGFNNRFDSLRDTRVIEHLLPHHMRAASHFGQPHCQCEKWLAIVPYDDARYGLKQLKNILVGIARAIGAHHDECPTSALLELKGFKRIVKTLRPHQMANMGAEAKASYTA